MTASLDDFRFRIRRLFLVCNQLRESTSLVNQTIREVYEVSLRSGISSSHVETGKRAFNEIAKQIARTSNDMDTESLQIRNIGSRISNLSLECLKRSLQVKKMHEADQLGCAQNTKAVYTAIARMEKAVFGYIDEIETLCRKTTILSANLNQHAERLWSLAINLRMEASQSGDQEEVFFSNIAEAISVASQKLKEQQDGYRDLIRQCREIREELQSFQGEFANAS